MNLKDRIGIYVHIPFCVRKCDYCDFLSFPAETETHKNYVNALCKQIDAAGDKRPVASVYFGGGTPSSIDPALITEILCKLKERFTILPDAEITIEVNPKTVCERSLRIYRDSGFNRLSIGLQSANDDELKLLGRIHTYDDFQNAYQDAKTAGFSNINVDLMTALPGMDQNSLAYTLDQIVALEPAHISAYSLILEEGTPFYERYKGNPVALPGEEEERGYYWQVHTALVSNGYEHYEISNFAQNGLESRHNCACWNRQDYLGFGLGASSLYLGERFRSHTDLQTYLGDPCGRIETTVLTKQDCMEEFMFLGLRLLNGISEADFEDSFGIPLFDVYGEEVEKLHSRGLIQREKGRIFLTHQGIDYGNYVFSRFLL